MPFLGWFKQIFFWLILAVNTMHAKKNWVILGEPLLQKSHVTGISGDWSTASFNSLRVDWKIGEFFGANILFEGCRKNVRSYSKLGGSAWTNTTKPFPLVWSVSASWVTLYLWPADLLLHHSFSPQWWWGGGIALSRRGAAVIIVCAETLMNIPPETRNKIMVVMM